MSKPFALDLFAGAGGTHLGLAAAGYKVFGVDNWDRAVETHVANGKRIVKHDLQRRTVPARYRGRVDLLWGSPPCPPFSQATDGIGKDDPRDCIPAWLRAVETVMAPVVMMENVKGLASPRHADYLENVVSELSDMGYRAETRVLNAADYGWPQARKRMYLVARLNGKPRFPEVSDSPAPSMGEFLGWTPRQAELRAINGGDPSWVFERPAMTVVGSFKPEVMAAPGYRPAGGPSRQNAPGSVVLLEQEAAALQGFPPGYKFVGSAADRWLQIGNAVIPHMARILAGANK